MTKTTFLTAAAALAMMVGASATASAQQAPYVNGSDASSKYKVTVTNKASRNVWMTFYKSQFQSTGQAGQACIPPGQTITFGYSGWGTSVGGDLRGELKGGKNCGGETLRDSVLVTANNAPIWGSTARLVIINTPGNLNDIQGQFTQ